MGVHPKLLFAQNGHAAKNAMHALSVCEAESFLKLYRCTLSPAAREVAAFIRANWPSEQIARLSREAQHILSDCLEEGDEKITPEYES